MNPIEADLLHRIIETGRTERPIADATLAVALQAGGLAIVTYLSDGKHINVRPTETGKRWHALVKRHTANQKRLAGEHTLRMMGGTR